MLKLYGGTFSRASIVEWYLNEIEVLYEFVTLDMKAGQHRQDNFLRINPIGKVPTLVDDKVTLSESGGILLYLADKHQQLPASPEARGKLYQWVLFANSTLGEGLFNDALREKQMPQLLWPLDDLLKTQPYLVGDSFTVADVAVGAVVGFATQTLKLDLSAYLALLSYAQRLGDRPAFKEAMAPKAQPPKA
ncbi:MAG: glutathione S-transferase family protein [Elainellaceae cyanobacterium]